MAPKKTRRARGSGSIFFNAARGRWVGRAPVGKGPNGKTLYRECWGKTQGEVVRRMAAAQPPGPDVTVAAWAARWLKTLTNREQSARSYAERLEHVLPVLGHLRVTAVTAADIEHLAARLLPTLANSTTVGVLAVCGIMFRAAVRARLIATNPVADARRPKVAKTRREVYAPAELVAVIGAASWYAGAGPVALIAACGCRIGEAIALDVPDFDPAAGTIAITKTLVSKLGAIGPPKSGNGVRTIRLPRLVLPVLAAAAGARATGPLFRTTEGSRFWPSGIDRAVRLVFRDLGLTVRGSHSLRHSVASALVAAGEPIADVAKYLGDDVATVVKTYVHATGTDPAGTLERLYDVEKKGRKS